MRPSSLNLPEQLLLLAFYEEKANALNSSLSFGLIGAVLSELLIQGKIHRKGISLVCRTEFTEDEILNDTLVVMASSSRERSARYWVNHLNGDLKRLRPRLMEQLAAKGFLTVTDDRIFGVFPHKGHRLTDPHAALALKDELRQVMFRPFAPSPRQVALIGLMKPAGLKVFTREERGAAQARISEILKGDPISKAVSEAVADTAGAAGAVIAVAAASA